MGKHVQFAGSAFRPDMYGLSVPVIVDDVGLDYGEGCIEYAFGEPRAVHAHPRVVIALQNLDDPVRASSEAFNWIVEGAAQQLDAVLGLVEHNARRAERAALKRLESIERQESAWHDYEVTDRLLMSDASTSLWLLDLWLADEF